MDAARPVSRRSALDFIVAPEQQPCRTSSLGGGPGKSKRHSWSFRSSSSRSRDASPRRNREPASLLSPPASDSRSRSASPAKSAPQTRVSSPERIPERPRSSHGFKFRVPNFTRTLPPRGSTLPTIMEQKGASPADSLRSRMAVTRVKLWDGRTRTTVPWDGLRRVSLS
jgi:hypothetical protein